MAPRSSAETVDGRPRTSVRRWGSIGVRGWVGWYTGAGMRGTFGDLRVLVRGGGPHSAPLPGVPGEGKRLVCARLWAARTIGAMARDAEAGRYFGLVEEAMRAS